MEWCVSALLWNNCPTDPVNLLLNLFSSSELIQLNAIVQQTINLFSSLSLFLAFCYNAIVAHTIRFTRIPSVSAVILITIVCQTMQQPPLLHSDGMADCKGTEQAHTHTYWQWHFVFGTKCVRLCVMFVGGLLQRAPCYLWPWRLSLYTLSFALL